MFYIGSVLLSLCVVQLVMAFVLLTFWRMRLNTSGLLEMALAMGISSVGALLAGIGASTANQVLGFIGIQAFVVAVLLAVRSIRRLQGLPPKPLIEAGVLALCVIGDAYAFFVIDKFAVALALNSILYAVISGWTAFNLFRETRPDLKPGCRVLGAMFATFAAASLIRAGVRLFVELPRPTTLEVISVDLVYVFFAIAVSIGWTLGFIWTSYNVAEYRLRAANEKLDRFTGAVAHDLNTPLNAVIGYLGALEHLPENDGARRSEFIATAHKAALRMSRFIHELLEESRAGHNGAAPEPVDTQACITEALQPLRPKITDAGADVRVGDIHDVMGNAFQLLRVFQNLFDNAVKYRDAERPLVIDISSHSVMGWVEISVADNGVGIPPADQAYIFRRFRRASDSKPLPGYGLGLSECQRVVESFGGSIRVVSEPGAGSTFVVRLPAAA